MEPVALRLVRVAWSGPGSWLWWAWRLIEAGGLTQGGAFAAGTRDGVADGGGTIFEAEIDGVFTYVHAPNLYDGASGARAALRELVRELFASYRDRDDGQEVPLRWVMYGPVAKDVEGVPWPGSEVPEGKPPCVEFEPESVGSEFELLTRNRYYEDMAVSFAGTTYAMQGRPLFPHERGCGDVQEMLERIATNDASIDLGESAR